MNKSKVPLVNIHFVRGKSYILEGYQYKGASLAPPISKASISLSENGTLP